MSEPEILFWDLEMSPMETTTWSLWPNSIPINMILKEPRVICYGARWMSQRTVTVRNEFHHGREEMLKELHETLDRADALVSWNGKGFDTKQANREFMKMGWKPPSKAIEIDLMLAVKRMARFPSNKLDWVSQELGVGQKIETSFSLWRDCLYGEGDVQAASWRKMVRYQKQDVNLLVDLYDELLPWIPGNMHPNMSLGSLEESCTKCDSDNLERRGFSLTTAGKFQRFQCRDCGSWSRATKRADTSELRPA